MSKGDVAFNSVQNGRPLIILHYPYHGHNNEKNSPLKYYFSVIFKVHIREQYSALNYWLRQPRFI